MFTDYWSWVRAGARMVRRRMRVARKGTKRYDRPVKDICAQAVEDCWNGTFFQTSAGHFCGFYVRDFAWCVHALDHARALRTMEYALERFSRQRLSTTISPSGRCFDVFTYAPDSLAWLLYSLRVLEAKGLVDKYRAFLEKELERFTARCMDPRTGLITEKRFFSSIKDHAKRCSATYDNWMAVLVAREAKALGLRCVLYHKTITDKIIGERWSGSFFCDDASSAEVFSADANVFPFWLGLVTDKGKWARVVKTIERRGIDSPVGLAYGASDSHRHNLAHLFAGNYEGTARWMHLGLIYLDTLRVLDHAAYRKVLDRSTAVVLRDRNVLEVYNPDGSAYKNLWYHTDEGMLWAAILARHLT